MRHQAVLEKGVTNRIVAALKKIPSVIVRKRHGTVMGTAGDPDLYGLFRGRHFEIEVKRPNDRFAKLTELQAQRLLEWKLAGAIVGVAHSVQEALAILGIPGQQAEAPEPVWLCAGCLDHRRQSAEPPARCPACGHTRFTLEAAGAA